MTDDDLKQAKEVGKLITPFLAVYVATQLAAARYAGAGGRAESEEWRRGVMDDSLRDALMLLKVI